MTRPTRSDAHRSRLLLRRAGTVGLVLLVAGCAGGEQSALSPQGTQAQAIDGVWQLMLLLGSIVWILVAAAVGVAVVRGRRRRQEAGEEVARRGTIFVALAGAVVPALVILVVTVQSIVVLRANDPSQAEGGRVVELVGHQYWWEVRYPDADVVTANEIHIPVGERVQIQVTSRDVVHSLWVPALSGKIDLVPGRSNTTWFETEETGTYWGQCAEFCGLQHANMRLVVVAHEPGEFDSWLEHQAEPAAQTAPRPQDGSAPEDDVAEGTETLVERGREVFMSSSCVYCHTVAGTAAQGELGPDLTHLASRETLAAGILPNEPGHLAGWIVDPQAIKPGNLMPGTDLDGEDLQAMLAYLDSLE